MAQPCVFEPIFNTFKTSVIMIRICIIFLCLSNTNKEKYLWLILFSEDIDYIGFNSYPQFLKYSSQ